MRTGRGKMGNLENFVWQMVFIGGKKERDESGDRYRYRDTVNKN